MNLEPVIRYNGSKRSQAFDIIRNFPKTFDTYYEPFCGGASVLFALLHSDIRIKHYIASDLNSDLIALYNAIKTIPTDIANHYEKLWNELNKDNDIERKKEFYNSIRDRLNKNHDPLDFMFIMRTVINGRPRYNSLGDFNCALHLSRNGIIPNSLREIILYWNMMLNKYDVEFVNCSYEHWNPSKSDFMYLDPPYANTSSLYLGNFDNDKFFNWLRTVRCPYAWSYDGYVDLNDSTYDLTFSVPDDLYDNHIYLQSGKARFRSTHGATGSSMVYESLYLKGIKFKVVNRKKLF